MFATFKGNNCSIGCQTMWSALLFITFLITLIDAQLDAPKTEFESKTIGETSKRAAFLPSRGRRFWSIFDWTDNSGEKRMSRFLPMRGRKAGFLPSRGKKSSPDQFSDDYSYGYPINSYENDVYSSRSSDGRPNLLDNSALEGNSRDKKAFHAMRGKKAAPEEPYYLLKKASNFFGARG